MGEDRQDEIPLTPAMIATLGDVRVQTARYGALVLGVLLVSLLGWGIYVNNAAAWVRVGLSLAAAVVIECFVVFYRNSKVPADRASGRCLRLTGLIHGQEVDGGAEGVDSYYLVVADVGRYRTYNPRLIRQLRDPAWRSMDMSKHTNVVFEVRDEHGAVVYRDPRYCPDDANEAVVAYSEGTVHAPTPVMPPQGESPALRMRVPTRSPPCHRARHYSPSSMCGFGPGCMVIRSTPSIHSP